MASPATSAIDDDGVELLDDAVDALNEGDDVAYERLVDRVDFGEVWVPTPAILSLRDRDALAVLEWSSVLDSENFELLDEWAYGAIERERAAVGLIGDSMNQDEIDQVNDADEDGSGVLEVIVRRGIQLPSTTQLVLSSVASNDDFVPSDEDYADALTDLDELIDELDGNASIIDDGPAVGSTSNDVSATTDAVPTTVPTTAEVAAEPADDTADDTPGALTASPEQQNGPADAAGSSGQLSLAVVLPIGLAAFALLIALFTMLKGRRSDQLADIAFTDDLTGLHNRRRLDADVAAQRSRGERATAALMVDVDHFKKFNDTHGHAMGDEVLRLVGNALGREFRKTDVPYRYGGEEFCILLEDATPDEAVAAGERARRAIEAISLPIEATITASIGVSIGPAAGLDDTIRRADSALYEAKGAGRNRVATA